MEHPDEVLQSKVYCEDGATSLRSRVVSLQRQAQKQTRTNLLRQLKRRHVAKEGAVLKHGGNETTSLLGASEVQIEMQNIT